MAGTTSGSQEAATAWSGSSVVGGTHLSILITTPLISTQGTFLIVVQFSVLCFINFVGFISPSCRGSLYAATVADFSATDSLIIKNQLRTEQYDYMHLNSPDFVGALEDEEHVYFFFREAAVEFMNCGKAVYSRVARVCKNDEGGSHKFANR